LGRGLTDCLPGLGLTFDSSDRRPRGDGAGDDGIESIVVLASGPTQESNVVLGRGEEAMDDEGLASLADFGGLFPFNFFGDPAAVSVRPLGGTLADAEPYQSAENGEIISRKRESFAHKVHWDGTVVGQVWLEASSMNRRSLREALTRRSDSSGAAR
jgi:hypothetical protein